MGRAPFLRIGSPSWTSELDIVNNWLLEKAIHVPDGWIEACVTWLVDEHGGSHACNQLTETNWCQLIYDQWLHTDLHQLTCPVLPDFSAGQLNSASAMLLEGELCLQIVSLLDIGESYYGQLRRIEGNLSKDLPDLEGFSDYGGEVGNHNWTQMTQAARSHYDDTTTSSRLSMNSMKSPALILTDGVTVIKAVEFGTINSNHPERQTISPIDSALRLRPGVKLRLRGPVTLRRNVLLLPPGSIRFLDHPQLQVLGGEVDELLGSPNCNTSYQLGLQLAKKLNVSIGSDGTLPTWFPRIPHEPLGVQRNLSPAPIEAHLSVHNAATSDDHEAMVMDAWATEDDALLNQAASTLENQMNNTTQSLGNNSDMPMIQRLMANPSTVPNQSHPNPIPQPDTNQYNPSDFDLDAEVDPDVLASAFDDLDNTMSPNLHRVLANVPSPSPASTPQQEKIVPIFVNTSDPIQPVVIEPSSSTSDPAEPVVTADDDLLPPLLKRKPWLRKPMAKGKNKLESSSTSTSNSSVVPSANDAKFTPFCYIDDMYNELINSNTTIQRRVYTIRGILLNLVSPLTHHQGTKWSLAARLTDGSATVDVDIASELLTEWIGLTAAEGESLRQLSRVDSNASIVATQEAAKHRHRLRTAVNNFQDRLSHLSGLFDITPPPAMVASTAGGKNVCENLQTTAEEQEKDDKPIRPILVALRQLDEHWLSQLHKRVHSQLL